MADREELIETIARQLHPGFPSWEIEEVAVQGAYFGAARRFIAALEAAGFCWTRKEPGE